MTGSPDYSSLVAHGVPLQNLAADVNHICTTPTGDVDSSQVVNRTRDATGGKEEAAVQPCGFRQYPAYKESGVGWLEEIPAHWGINTVSRVTDCLDRRRIPLNAVERGRMQGTYPYWGANSIVDYVNQWLFDEELVLLGEDGAPFFDQFRPVAFYVTGKIWVNNHAHVLRARTNFEARFLMHVLNCVDYRAFIAGSTRDKLTQSEMQAIPIQCPEIGEQRAIVSFLDRETSKINHLIKRKERLIELLQEKRTALISHAVTRGLNPDVPLKESGVEWLGKIPEHWDVKRLKQVSFVENSGNYGAEPGEAEIHLPVCTTAHLTMDGVFQIDAMPVRSFSSGDVKKYAGVPGDIFVVKSSGSNTNIISGKLGLVTETTPRIVFSNFLMRIRPNVRFAVPGFLAYLLRSRLTRERIKRMVATTTYPNINVADYVRSAIPLPLIFEQNQIVTFLDRETAKLDLLTSKIRQAIKLLTEYRIALISAAVTGKIDVREAAS